MDAIFWDDSGGDTYCCTWEGCGEYPQQYHEEFKLQTKVCAVT